MKNNKWLNFIISPKLDGTRALLVFKNQAIYLVFENRIEVLCSNFQLETLVFETEVYENGIYIYDIHYKSSLITHISYLGRLGFISTIL